MREALETDNSVVLAPPVKTHRSSGPCTDQAKMQRVTIKLKRPLDQRVLLDVHTDQPILHKGPHTISAR